MLQHNRQLLAFVRFGKRTKPAGCFRRKHKVDLPLSRIIRIAGLRSISQVAARHDWCAAHEVPDFALFGSSASASRLAAPRHQFCPRGQNPAVSAQRFGLRTVGTRIFDKPQFQLAASLNHSFCTRRVAFTRQLHKNFIVIAAPALNRWLGQAESIDAPINRLKRLRHRVFLYLRDGARTQCQQITRRFSRCGSRFPQAAVLLLNKIAEHRRLCRIHVAHQNVGIVHTADFIVANILVAQLLRQTVHHLVGFLRDRFLHLHLQHEVRAALQVQAEFDLLAEIVFDLRDRSGEGRKSDQSIDAEKDHRKNKQRFPLQIRIHD